MSRLRIYSNSNEYDRYIGSYINWDVLFDIGFKSIPNEVEVNGKKIISSFTPVFPKYIRN